MRAVSSSSGTLSWFLPLLVVLWIDTTAFAMRLVVQRVKSASVTVGDKVVSQIGPGLVALVGLHESDDEKDADFLARKLLACKLWENDNGAPWRQSVKQKGFDVLLISQFTLYGRLSRKNQPDYQDAMKSVPAKTLYADFVEQVRKAHTTGQVCDGIFGAMMDVKLVNDGPVTIVIDSPTKAIKDSEETGTASATTTDDGSSETA